MNRNPRDLQRYNASERANHWIVGICFILLVLSGLAFFHPAFFPLVHLFGGGPWTRILHPYVGLVMMFFFIMMFFRFWRLNMIEKRDVGPASRLAVNVRTWLPKLWTWKVRGMTSPPQLV